VFAQTNIDSVFIKWNKVTLQSLEQQNTPGETIEAKLYNNRIEVLKGYLEIDSITSINPNSMRYQFLTILHTKYKFENSVLFVLEANESGYMVTLRNLVVRIDSSHTANIEFYEFFDGRWHFTGDGKLNNFYIKNDRKDWKAIFGQGFNKNGDIIVTKFNNSKIDDCEYYLIATLSKKSGVENIINAYRSKRNNN
jgi:hypothetical protein